MKTAFAFYSQYLDADLTDLYLLSKFNKGIRLLLSVTDSFRKYACFNLLKDENVFTFTDTDKKLMNLDANKINNALIKTVNFTIDQ